MPGADGPPVCLSFTLLLVFCSVASWTKLSASVPFLMMDLSVVSSQGHPGKEGPPGTKGNQVGVVT